MPEKTLALRRRERIEFVQKLVDLCMEMIPVICDVNLYSYQDEIADRILFSLLIGDAEEITVETARQSGKSEVLACVAAISMVLFPMFARLYPDDPILRKFKNGIMIGIFAPVDWQADAIFSRIELRLTHAHAKQALSDPEFDEEAKRRGNLITMRNFSFCRRQTAEPSAQIVSSTYHLIIEDEAQDCDSQVIRTDVHPMMAAVGGTIVKVGTASDHKSDYWEAEQRNKRRGDTNGKHNHFYYHWKRAAKENVFYRTYMKKEIQRLGEDSDEFLMSYCGVWLLERGMFITPERAEQLQDPEMQMVRYYSDSPIVVGLDVAAKHDSTVATAIWVDWEHPDTETGLYNHQILNWMELHGENWETQYEAICDFVHCYNVMIMGVDAQGMGGPVAERLQLLLPNIDVRPLPMNPADQSERWQHLMQLIQRGLIGWPAHPLTRRSVVYRRFMQQLLDAEKEYKNKYLLVGAPKNEKNAHDDFLDSLALGCALTKDFGVNTEVEVWNVNPFYSSEPVRR